MARDNSPRTGISDEKLPPTQDNRLGRLTIPSLPKDKLVLSSFECHEGMSELFEVRIDALSEEEDIDFDKALGRPCEIALDTYNGDTRFFHGILAGSQWVGVREGYYAYKLVLRPWLWLLGRKANCRIFKEMTACDIIKKVFNDNGFGDEYFKNKVTRDSQKFEYFVQYRETDLAFVSRIMEEYGFYTYFVHEQGKHVLHIADSHGGHERLKVAGQNSVESRDDRVEKNPALRRSAKRSQGSSDRSQGTGSSGGSAGGGAKIPFMALSGNDRRVCQHFTAWIPDRKFRTGKFSLRDHDYMQSTTVLKSEKQTAESYEKAKAFENYDYPGRWTKQDEGDQLVKVRLEAEQALDHRMLASGDAPNLFPGASFSLDNHATDNGDYVVVRADHSYGTQHYRATASGGTEQLYGGQYEIQENVRPYRAPHVTPRPKVYGPQTAFVVRATGVSNNEEIDVDKDGRILVNFHWNREDKQDFCSRRVRVAQMWAGKGWGWQMIPRVGMEVIVEFLEGDPDQPIVTGAVYNSDYTYPYTLPANKTQSGVKTDSTPDSGNAAYNEFKFEDKVSEEKVEFRAEKDLASNIRNTETRRIAENFKGGASDPVRTTDLVLGSDVLTLTKGNSTTTLKDGNMKVQVTGKIEISATEEIKIKVGSSVITLKPTGIAIEAPKIDITATGNLTQKGAMILLN